MTRDELAARLFVVLAQEQEREGHAHFNHAIEFPSDDYRYKDRFKRLADRNTERLVSTAFKLADDFEAERKRRLAEPDGA